MDFGLGSQLQGGSVSRRGRVRYESPSSTWRDVQIRKLDDALEDSERPRRALHAESRQLMKIVADRGAAATERHRRAASVDLARAAAWIDEDLTWVPPDWDDEIPA